MPTIPCDVLVAEPNWNDYLYCPTACDLRDVWYFWSKFGAAEITPNEQTVIDLIRAGL